MAIVTEASFGLGITALLDQPLCQNPSSVANDSPLLFPISINGRSYDADTSFEPYRRDAFRHRSIPSQRTSADITNIPGEATINTEGLWRREQQDWRGGSGQQFFDRKDSDPTRFHRSKGVDPWFPWQLTLQPDTVLLKATADPLAQVVTVGAYVYLMTSTALQYSSDLATWTTVTGLPSTMVSLTTDGFNVWIATTDATNAVYATTAGASSATAYVTWSGTAATVNIIRYCGARLMLAAGPYVWNITATGKIQTASGVASPDATGGIGWLFHHSNSNFAWSCIAAGEGQVYLGGYSGNVSEVYRTQVETSGSSLEVPILSAPLPRGELVYGLYGYLNFVVMGTSAGARFCETLNANDPSGNAGDLRLGAIVPTIIEPVTAPVRCFAGQNQFVWFGWSNYDSGSSGLGRMDLTNFVSEFTPAYASDLMATGQGEVTSMDWFGAGVTFDGKVKPTNGPVFVVQGVGLFGPASTYVPSGYVRGGYYTYGLPDDKIAVELDLKTVQPIVGSYSASISIDQGSFVSIGTITSSQDPNPLPIPQLTGEYLEPQITLSSGLSNTVTPTLLRSTLKSYPVVTCGFMISAVLNMFGRVIVGGQERAVDPYEELAIFRALYQSQALVTYQEGPFVTTVTVDEVDWLPFAKRDLDAEGGYVGDLIVYLKEVTS